MLDKLPPRQREVLYLVAVEDLLLAEVAEILRINQNTAKVHLSLARKRMREKFQAES
jgi:RNA polymerase sigma factor (sigma-70 family)